MHDAIHVWHIHLPLHSTPFAFANAYSGWCASGVLQAYDGALVRFKGAAAATNFAVALYQQPLAEHHQMKLVSGNTECHIGGTAIDRQ